MSEDQVKPDEQKGKEKDKNSITQPDEKSVKNEHKKTRQQPTRESKSRKRVPNRKRTIENRETRTLGSAIELDLESMDVKEEQLVHRLDATTITIDGIKYEIVKDYKDAFDGERLGERYSEILDKYDYIVADWGFEQLRLKGFYDNRNRKVPQDQRINNLEDYLYEYCNFGCPYFVIQRLEAPKNKPKKESVDKIEKPVRRKRNPKGKNPIKQKQEIKIRETKMEEDKNRRPISPRPKPKPKPKRDFVKKEVTPVSAERKKVEEKATFKPTNETKGKRHFNIRRKESETGERKEEELKKD